ncbi:hypothetical protein NIES22_02600 [Calothrix brevissima NIES-22]|nr:hypothetical protein NIES22_02600 [Calothrix brevissima NIES-22]
MELRAAEATTKFAELLSQVLLGEEVVIAEQGIPLARLVPIANNISPRIPGLDKGKVFMTSDFNEPLPEEILSDFENSHIV